MPVATLYRSWSEEAQNQSKYQKAWKYTAKGSKQKRISMLNADKLSL